MRHPRILVSLVVATALMGVTACGDSGSTQDAASPKTVTVEKTAPQKASEPKAQEKKAPAKQQPAGQKDQSSQRRW